MDYHDLITRELENKGNQNYESFVSIDGISRSRLQ